MSGNLRTVIHGRKSVTYALSAFLIVFPVVVGAQGLLGGGLNDRLDGGLRQPIDRVRERERSVTKPVEKNAEDLRGGERIIDKEQIADPADKVIESGDEALAPAVGELLTPVVKLMPVDEDATGVGVGQIINQAEALTGDFTGTSGLMSVAGAAMRPILSLSGQTLFHEMTSANGWLVVANEWILLVNRDEIPVPSQPGIEIIDTNNLDSLGMQLVRLRIDDDAVVTEAVREMLARFAVDRNHIYEYQPQTGIDNYSATVIPALTTLMKAPVCKDGVSVGMVDTVVNRDHPALTGATISQQTFTGGAAPANANHGTGIAGLLVAQGNDSQLLGAVPNARLSVAAVMYGRDDDTQGATALGLVRALDWLVEQNVKVINLSLAGPPNLILERALEKVAEKGVTVVAAVGNRGPASAPLYPAAYDSVIGVTAVDADNRVYRWANRGYQVDFAARGVKVSTLDGNGGVVVASGTSLSSAVVTGFVACALTASDNASSERSTDIVSLLAKDAVDAGAAGRDTTFGLGILNSVNW